MLKKKYKRKPSKDRPQSRLVMEMAKVAELPNYTVLKVLKALRAVAKRRLIEGDEVYIKEIGRIYTLSKEDGTRLLKFQGSRYLKRCIKQFVEIG
jgi:hypothetical protein